MAQANRNGVASGHARSGKAKARAEAKARAKWEREADRRARLCYAVELGGEGHGMSPLEIRTLQGIAVGERTWTPAETLATAGLNGSTLSGLVEQGWVEEFALEEGNALTFSPWAVEALGLDTDEHWEVHPGIANQQDSALEKTNTPVREPHEVPRWNLRPSPPEPGIPKPKPRPIKLPFLYRLSQLPEEVVKGMLARTIADPVEEAIQNEEIERYLEREARTETGQLDVDTESGKIRVEPITLWASPADDGLKGGVSDPHGGKIPLDPRMATGRKPGKKKKRRRRRSA
jgi:hypothetical protein